MYLIAINFSTEVMDSRLCVHLMVFVFLLIVLFFKLNQTEDTFSSKCKKKLVKCDRKLDKSRKKRNRYKKRARTHKKRKERCYRDLRVVKSDLRDMKQEAKEQADVNVAVNEELDHSQDYSSHLQTTAITN